MIVKLSYRKRNSPKLTVAISCFIAGVLLLLVSLWSIYSMLREQSIRRVAYSRYKLRIYDTLSMPTRYGGHNIKIDSIDILKIKLDDVNVLGTSAEQTQYRIGTNASVTSIYDVWENQNSLAITLIEQNNKDCRIIFVNENGKVTFDTFPISERIQRLERTPLIRLTGDWQIGFYTNSSDYYPSIFYPILFPFGTIIIAITLLYRSLKYWLLIKPL